jgi:hypothetical protein
MSSFLFRSLAFGAPIATTVYLAAIYNEVSPVPSKSISVSHTPPASMRTSDTARTVVNPRGFASAGDARWATISVPKSVPNEQLLAMFLKGFFGSYIFAPEAAVLNTLGRASVTFSGNYYDEWILPPKDTDHLTTPSLEDKRATRHLWHASQIKEQTLPQLHSVLFGIFRVADIQLSTSSDGDDGTESSVDISFGSDSSHFAGYHRITVSRMHGEGERSDVRVGLGCFICDPIRDREPASSGRLRKFHLLYASLLFRSGVARIIRQFGTG